MTNKKSPDSYQDFSAFNLTFDHIEFAKLLILHWCKEFEGGTEEKFKKIQGLRWWQ